MQPMSELAMPDPHSRPAQPNAGTTIGLFIDVANAQDVDFRQLLCHIESLGRVVEARAYGDFRQHHLGPIAIELYVLGVEMVHCPSWPNGGQLEDGTRKRKMTDDRLLEKAIRDLLASRNDVETYAIVISDADIIPACHAIKRRGKQLILFCPDPDTKVGHVLRMCEFDIEPAPMLRAHGCVEARPSSRDAEAVAP